MSDKTYRPPELVENQNPNPGFSLDRIPNFDSQGDNVDPQVDNVDSQVDNVDKREIYVSEVFNYDDKNFHQYILSALSKMACSKRSNVQIQKGSMCLYLREQSAPIWKPLPVDLDAKKFPNNKSKGFYLLDVLGEGGEGKVWRACNSAGKLCALKTWHKLKENEPEDLKRKERIQQEVEIWRTVWGFKEVFQTNLFFQDVLVTPILQMAPSEMSGVEKDILINPVKEAIRKLHEHKYFHSDLKWSNVGFFKRDGRIQAALIDVPLVSEKDIPETPLVTMMKNLKIN